jgi:type I restriction enzyme R subunit
MNMDNFIVRPKRQYVEKFIDRETWNSLDENQVSEIYTHIKKLPTEADAFNSDEINNELAKRFDYLILQIQLEYLKSQKLPESLRLNVMEIASNLEAKSSIPAIAKHLTLIQEIQTNEYWQYITLPMLEEIRRKIRTLIQFTDKITKGIVFTDFEDDLGEAVIREPATIYNANNLAQYRKKVEAYIKSHEDQLTIHKLKRNIPITAKDLEVLENILFQASGLESKEDFIKTIANTKQLGVFVRELVGLDRSAAKEAFAEFLDEAIYNATQIYFINRIIDYLTVNGIMEAGALFKSQFTDIHDEGVFGFFAETQVTNIVNKLEVININSSIDNAVNF